MNDREKELDRIFRNLQNVINDYESLDYPTHKTVKAVIDKLYEAKELQRKIK